MYDIVTVKKLNQYLNDNQNLCLNQESTQKNMNTSNYRMARPASTENEAPRRVESVSKKSTNAAVMQSDKDKRTNRSQVKESPKSILNSSTQYKKGNDQTLYNKLESARSTSPYVAANKPTQAKNNLSFLNLSLQSNVGKGNQSKFQPSSKEYENNPFLALSSESTTSNWREITFKMLLTEKEYRLLQFERAKQIKLS